MTKNKHPKRILLTNIIILLLLLLSSFFFVASRYKKAHFNDAQIDEIIFYFMNGLADGQTSNFATIVQDNILLCATILFLLLIPVIDFYRDRILIHFDLSVFGKKQEVRFNPSKISLKFKLTYSIAVFLLSAWLLLSSFGVFGYLRSLALSGQLYEQHYADPSQVHLVFPEKKRNLIYIYLESMENTVASKEHGGQAETSLIPELEALATNPQNVSFSNQPSGLGGAVPVRGTTWTVAAMVAQSSGAHLKSSGTSLVGEEGNGYGNFNKFLPGAYTLGDILEKEGYNQTFLMGSEASFGGRDKLLSQHGNYTIKDYSYAKEHSLIPEDYSVWWGYEDKKLIDFAKTELETLSRSDKPFNLQLLTADTHFTDGYLDPSCDTPYENQYDNVYACSSKLIGEFIDWIEQQDFASNTTIVISGDHPGMQTAYYDEKITDSNYQRTVYNTFINPAISPINEQNRLFTTLDMYPTTLAAMGVGIEGDRLGLGTNLFSDQPTLIEHLGSIQAFNEELSRRSNLYERTILVNSEN